MAENTYAYPFDPSGSKVSNLIVNEQQVLTPPPLKDFHFIIPKLAPFFKKGLTVHHVDTNRDLVEGIDYVITHRFIGASRATARPIYGSITFYDKTLSGIVSLRYQTIGGEWTLDESKLLQMLQQTNLNPRIITWEQVAEVPKLFPPIDHQWHLDDMVGATELRDAILTVADRILETADIREDFRAHKNARNPHGTTKEDMELGQVANHPPATRTQAIEGQNATTVMSPLTTRQALEAYVGETLYTQEEVDDMLGEIKSRLNDLEN